MKQQLQAQARVPSPMGPLTLAATQQGLAIVWFDDQAHRTLELDAPVDAQHPHVAQAAREFQAYWKDARTRFTVPLDPAGTAFQQAVWKVLLGIEAGALSTYGDVARQIGKPDAVRAVGAAVGRNPLGIIVPCHRVVGSNGSLTGYAGGLPRKEELLRREGALLT
jgi:methylated-DNA-[protein]-cysteine S-methyltransferase